MKFDSLSHALSYIRQQHPLLIDYHLHRIRQVAANMDLLSFSCPVILVAGTNGKGTVVATLEAMILSSGQRCGSFTSPYLQNFNEQIHVNGIPVSDTVLCEAFNAIEIARQGISLSEFEWTTLAALFIFKQHAFDFLLLEIGLGGAQDAVNIVEPDVTVITTIALDHEEYLGHTLTEIAMTESQLLRPHKKAVLGMQNAEIFLSRAAEINCEVFLLGRDFQQEPHSYHTALALKTLACFNKMPYPPLQIRLSGRLQFISGQPAWLIDVAHNLEAVELLYKKLTALQGHRRCLAVFSMLNDKPIAAIVAKCKDLIDEWYIAPIDHPRTASKTQLEAAFQQHKITYQFFNDLNLACRTATLNAAPQDLVIAFGSFHVARAALLHAT